MFLPSSGRKKGSREDSKSIATRTWAQSGVKIPIVRGALHIDLIANADRRPAVS
jgi:hypothetical protein